MYFIFVFTFGLARHGSAGQADTPLLGVLREMAPLVKTIVVNSNQFAQEYSKSMGESACLFNCMYLGHSHIMGHVLGGVLSDPTAVMTNIMKKAVPNHVAFFKWRSSHLPTENKDGLASAYTSFQEVKVALRHPNMTDEVRKNMAPAVDMVSWERPDLYRTERVPFNIDIHMSPMP